MSRSISSADSLVRVLRDRADSRPDSRVFTFLVDGESKEEHLAFQDLDARARAIAATLQDRGLAGKTVMLLHPPGLDYVAALFGCFYAGAIAVPAYPPNPGDPSRSLGRLRTIANDAGASCALTTTAALLAARSVVEASGQLGDLEFLSTDDTPVAAAERWKAVTPSGSTLALLQYTSGSTGDPRGVEVTHANLLANVAAISECYRADQGTVAVVWLPPYHDMGLVGGILEIVWLGCSCVLMSPQSFVQNPLRWLKAIGRYRATASGGPDFAYETCARAYRRRPFPLDLGSWQVAFNGAEPIRAETLKDFAETFADCGFRSSAFVTNYGLAEATLLVTSSAPGQALPMLDVDREAMARGRVELPGLPSARTRTLVSSGRVARGSRLEIVDPLSGAALGEDRVGEIWVSGPGVASGYYKQPGASRATFGAQLDGKQDTFLRTGDLGFLHGGELYVSGRLKDLIIVHGRSIHPHDLERTAEAAHPAARAGGCAAFSIEDAAGREGVVILQEVGRKDAATEVGAAIRHALLVEHGLRPLEVVIVPRRTVLKTPSGKVRRQPSKKLWLEGRLEVLSVDRPATERSPAAASHSADELLVLLRREVAAVLDGAVSVDLLQAGQRLSALGLDSLALASLKTSLERLLDRELPVAFLLEDPTLETLAERIEEVRGRSTSPGAGPVVVTEARSPAATPGVQADVASLTTGTLSSGSPRFSLMFFSSYGGQKGGADKYGLVLDAARFADRAGFEAVWLPERHFHPFGGLFPNPAVVASAVASQTKRIRIRAGSVVLPLHDPIRVAEDWAVVDNLSGGRVDLSFATGWDKNSFVLAPERYAGRYDQIADRVQELRCLWRGDRVRRRNGAGEEVDVEIFPKPRQAEPGLWLTAAEDARVFELAGAAGYNILTALLFQSLETLRDKVARYRKARAGAGLDPRAGSVTLMLHTFVGRDLGAVRSLVREPFTRYLESSIQLWGTESQALSALRASERADVLELAFERYFQKAGLIGTVETTARTVSELKEIGVDEIACLIDFGVPDAEVLESLPILDLLRQRFAITPEVPRIRAPSRSLSSLEKPPSESDQEALSDIDLEGRHGLLARPTGDVFGRAELFDLPDRLREADLLPFYLEFTDMGPSAATVGGRPVIMMGGLDYLGLSADPRVREAASRAALATGTSRTGSRLHCGSTPEQRDFEALLASFLGREDAIAFASGYMAQSGLITALLDPDSVLLLDERAHASIVDGGLVARCRVRRFAHNDPGSLDQQLRRDAGAATLVMIESLYSNEGDLAPLPEIRNVCDRHGVRLAVDEAHGLGVLGATGRGLEEHFGMPGSIDVLTGTFSKSLASVGGWIAGSRKVVDWIRFHGRSILFSAAISPAALAAAHASLAILIGEPDRVARLRASSRRWRDLLVENGLPLVQEPAGPLLSVRVGDERTCLLFSRRLLEAGVYANTVLHPSVPRGEAIIRTVVSAAHVEDELVRAARAFGQVHRDLGVSAPGVGSQVEASAL